MVVAINVIYVVQIEKEISEVTQNPEMFSFD